ncbi:uncharacterized protein LOC132718627 [Ruditapes philippinarum]|uniref:uncharacterized protein LOC132718627 n=1 Tax=Ruditapes philippinarum TaxID=129788 RepID=UPI00295B068A|nr:uncharacterized protein LOC132718627 [Ruditapes philippinarum]
MEGFRRSQRDVFFVPVGNLDLDFINTMAACCDGMLLDHTYGTRFSRRQLLTRQLVDPFGMITDEFPQLSKEDMKDMRNIQERFKHHIEEHAEIVVDCVHMYEEKTSTTLPEIGLPRANVVPNWKYNNPRWQWSWDSDRPRR